MQSSARAEPARGWHGWRVAAGRAEVRLGGEGVLGGEGEDPGALPGEAPFDPHTRALVSPCVAPPGLPRAHASSSPWTQLCKDPDALWAPQARLNHVWAAGGSRQGHGWDPGSGRSPDAVVTFWAVRTPGQRDACGAKESRKPRGHGEERGVWRGRVPRVPLGGGPGPDPGDGSGLPPRLAASAGSQGRAPLGRVTAGTAACPVQSSPAHLVTCAGQCAGLPTASNTNQPRLPGAASPVLVQSVLVGAQGRRDQSPVWGWVDAGGWREAPERGTPGS